MKRIYKHIEVASSEVLLTLALFSDVGGAESVDAADLDRLEAQLSRPNYSGAEQLPVANVQRSHLEITDEGEVLAVLHRLKRGENRFVCKARYGTNISVQIMIDFVVTAPNEITPVEISENVVLVENIGDGSGEFPTDYAKQGTNPNATLTDTQAYAQSAASDAAAAKVAVQSLTSLDSDINAGKSAIALAISNKGVPTSSADAMLQMAANIQQIAQSPITIDGGEMYAKQLFGSLTTPNYWNLYEVLANLLSDGRLANYGGILLAEYYKGYDSLALSGAGAGGAYVVSDKDANGQFIMYTADTTHTWDTEDDGKGNRWVAYCLAAEYTDFNISNTNTSPRSIFIGRKIGVIRSLANTRVSKIVVPDGNSLMSVRCDNYNSFWDRRVILRNIKNQSYAIFGGTGGSVSYGVESIHIEADQISDSIFRSTGNYITETTLTSMIIKARKITEGIVNALYLNALSYLAFTVQEGVIKLTDADGKATFNALKELSFLDCDADGAFCQTITNKLPSSCNVYLEKGSNTNSFNFTGNAWVQVENLAIENDWCKGLDAHLLTALTEANMYAHILQRLKQDEPDCGDGVTITLGATNLAKLTSQESVDLLDVLTNTYGYTFA